MAPPTTGLSTPLRVGTIREDDEQRRNEQTGGGECVRRNSGHSSLEPGQVKRIVPESDQAMSTVPAPLLGAASDSAPRRRATPQRVEEHYRLLARSGYYRSS